MLPNTLKITIVPILFLLQTDSHSLTLEQWKDALVQRPFMTDVTAFLFVPRLKAATLTSSLANGVEHEVTDTLKKLGSQLLKEIDPSWNDTVKVKFINEQEPTLQILPDGCQFIPTSSCYCPLKKSDHDTCATSVVVKQNGNIKITCFS